MSFEGEIGEIDLVQRLVELGREQFTGAIRFEQDGIIKIVYFKGGDVLSASTNDRTDAIDEILLRAGKVNREHLKQALAKRKESETLGDALLNLGFITRKELTWARRVQVIGILRSVRSWTKGAYAIVADYLPKREEGTIFPLAQIIVELFVTEQDRQTFERATDGGTVVYTKTDGFDAQFQRLGLNEEAAEVATRIDGVKSAADVASATAKDAFNVYKLLEALRALGLLKKVEVKDELAFESIGVADAADALGRRHTSEIAFQTEPETPVPSLSEEAPPPPAAMAPPPAIEPVEEPEPQWGFDEAQIEAAARAASPPPAPPPASPRRQTLSRQSPKKRSSVPMFALIVLLLVAGAIGGGWMWWSARKAPAPQPAPVAGATKRPAIRPTPVVSAGAPPAVITPPPATTNTAAATTTRSTTTLGGQPPPAVHPPTETGQGQPRTAVPQEPPPAFAPPSVKPAEPTRQRYETMAVEFARTASGNFTVQFELVCQTASLAKAIEAGGSNVWFVPISYHGQSCYRVFWGHYDTRESAERAAAAIPAAVRSGKPAVVSVPKP